MKASLFGTPLEQMVTTPLAELCVMLVGWAGVIGTIQYCRMASFDNIPYIPIVVTIASMLPFFYGAFGSPSSYLLKQPELRRIQDPARRRAAVLALRPLIEPRSKHDVGYIRMYALVFAALVIWSFTSPLEEWMEPRSPLPQLACATSVFVFFKLLYCLVPGLRPIAMTTDKQRLADFQLALRQLNVDGPS